LVLSRFAEGKEKMKYYWAVGLNFDYDILLLEAGDEPSSQAHASIKGPFKNLSDAKKQVREWISSDRSHLQDQLENINSLKKDSF
jgi:hypothetical protein